MTFSASLLAVRDDGRQLFQQTLHSKSLTLRPAQEVIFRCLNFARRDGRLRRHGACPAALTTARSLTDLLPCRPWVAVFVAVQDSCAETTS